MYGGGAVALAGGGWFFFLRDSGGGGGASGPVGVTKAFYSALDDGNVDEANSYIHSDSPQGEISSDQASFFEESDISVEETEVVEQSESQATVRVVLSISGDTQESRLELRKENGDWKLWG